MYRGNEPKLSNIGEAVILLSIFSPLRITIDGPAGVGKTSVGGFLAARMGYRFLDTGLMYRAFTLAAYRSGIRSDDNAEIGSLAAKIVIRVYTNSRLGLQILLDGKDVSSELHSPVIDEAVSSFSALSSVRTTLVAEQRRFADQGDVVIVGRDTGTIILPGAEKKFFLTASENTRVRRRLLETQRLGRCLDATVARNVSERDSLDSSRKLSPLSPADDAEVIDTEYLDLCQVIDELERLASSR